MKARHAAAGTAFLFLLHALLGARELVIAVTGETHGALEPCECPLEPDGGLARRAAFIRTLRKKTLENGDAFLLLDVGGNAAGGPFDIRPWSPETALVRTRCVFEAMSHMEYDAVAVGDDELAWGAAKVSEWAALVPMTLANLRTPCAGVEPFRTAVFDGFRVGVAALTVPPLMSHAPDRPDVDDGGLVEKASQIALPAADLQILISHAGEETSRRIALESRRFHLVLNANSKRSTLPYFLAGGVPVVQFSYETRRVMVARFRMEERQAAFITASSERLSDAVGEDAAAAGLVAGALKRIRALSKDGGRNVVTLFTMPFCPYSRPVEKRLLSAAREFSPWMSLDIRFIVSRNSDGSLSSLHGPDELDEARRRAVVREQYPERFMAFLRRRHERPEEAWDAAARDTGIMAARIRGAIDAGDADGYLERDAGLAGALSVGASPTLFVNNVRLDAEPLAERALAAVCTAIPGTSRPALCSELPECHADTDCAQPGMDVRCINPGTKEARCERTEAVAVRLVIVTPPESLFPVHERIKDALVQLFPGLQPREVAADAAEAAALLKNYPYDRLPGLFFHSEVKQAAGYTAVAGTLKALPGSDMLVVDPDASGANFYFHRHRQDGRLDIFTPVSSKAGRDAIETFLAWRSGRIKMGAALPEIGLRPLVFRHPDDGSLAAPGGLAALEDTLRVLAVRSAFPDKLLDYLKVLAATSGTSDWEEPLAAAGLAPGVIKELARSDGVAAMAGEEAALCEALGASSSVMLLYANQEFFIPANAGEMFDALERAAR